VRSCKDVSGRQSYSREDKLTLLKGATCIYFFFITAGRLQEKIFKFRSPAGQKFAAVWFLQLLDAITSTAVGSIGRWLRGLGPPLPQEIVCLSGFGQVISKWSLNTSLSVGLSFPVATLAKSAKMVPVMLGSLLLGGARFSARDVAQALALVLGTTVVSLGESSGKGKSLRSTWLGLAFVGLGLSVDGWIGGVQKKMKRRFAEQGLKESPFDFMFWNNVYMAAAALTFAVLTKELKKGVRFCAANPVVLRHILNYCLCSALGQVCVFSVMAKFDNVVVTQVTTTRKLVSVLISILSGEAITNKLTTWGGLTLAAFGVMGELS